MLKSSYNPHGRCIMRVLVLSLLLLFVAVSTASAEWVIRSTPETHYVTVYPQPYLGVQTHYVQSSVWINRPSVIYTAPIYTVPVYRAPVYRHVPVYRGPIYTAPIYTAPVRRICPHHTYVTTPWTTVTW